MIFLRYLLLALIAVVFKAVQFFLGWLLIAPFVKADGNLPRLLWLRLLFQPDDSPAIGDAMFGSREMWYTSTWRWKWAARWWRATQWGMRNPAYGWDSNVCGLVVNNIHSFTVSGNPKIEIGEFGAVFGSCFRTCINGNGGKYFEWKKVGQRKDPKFGYMISLGWNLTEGMKNGDVRNLRIDIRPKIAVR